MTRPPSTPRPCPSCSDCWPACSRSRPSPPGPRGWTASRSRSTWRSASLAVAILPLLRRHPLVGGLLLGVLAALSPAATPAATAGTYVVARRERLGIAIPVACASIVGHAVQALWRSVGLPLGWWLLCDVAVHAALLGWGAYGRTRDALVEQWRVRARTAERDQVRKVEEARSAERTRIAREMHDTLAHRLTLLATTAGALEYRTDLSPEQVSAAAGGGAGECRRRRWRTCGP